MTTDEALKMLKATGKIDRIGTTNPGRIIDLHNDLLMRQKEKDFKSHVSDMNHYYFKLLIDTVTQRNEGVLNPIYKSNSTSLSVPDQGIITT